jgi:hypothetical protein
MRFVEVKLPLVKKIALEKDMSLLLHSTLSQEHGVIKSNHAKKGG